MGKPDKNVLRALIMITQIGIGMLTPILLCAYGGYYLDQWLSTSYWFIILLMIGILAAFRNVYYLTKQFYTKDLKREEEELQYFESLKKEKNKK